MSQRASESAFEYRTAVVEVVIGERVGFEELESTVWTFHYRRDQQ